MEDAHEAELRAHDARGEERGRLGEGHGRLEFARTTELILRFLPAPPALVADVGGGPGRYALWLLGLGPHLLATGVAPLAGLGWLMLRMPGPRGFRGRASAPCERAQLELAVEVVV